jgi:hypothetical protein
MFWNVHFIPFLIFLQFLIEIWLFVSHVFFFLATYHYIPSLEKKILEFAFEVNLSIGLQKIATAWSNTHFSADKCYDNIFSCMSYVYIRACKIRWYKLNVSSVAETLSYYCQNQVSSENMTTTRLKWQEARLTKVRGNSGIATHSGRVHGSTKCCHH